MATDAPRRDRWRSWFGVARYDAGRVFFGVYIGFILMGWYPQLQDTYTHAWRGTSLGFGIAVLAVALGFMWGAGSLADILLVAASGALGCAAGFAFGAALTAELAAVRPFYASMFDRSTLEGRLWSEFLPCVFGAAAGGVVGAAAASVLAPPSRRLGLRSGVIALLIVTLAAVLAAGLGANSIALVATRVTPGPTVTTIDPGVIRVALLTVGCLAAASAALASRDIDRGPIIVVTGIRVAAGAALIAIPFLVAAVYRSFVLNPF